MLTLNGTPARSFVCSGFEVDFEKRRNSNMSASSPPSLGTVWVSSCCCTGVVRSRILSGRAYSRLSCSRSRASIVVSGKEGSGDVECEFRSARRML